MVITKCFSYGNQCAVGFVIKKLMIESIQATSRQYFTFSCAGLCCNRQIFELSKRIFLKKLRDTKWSWKLKRLNLGLFLESILDKIILVSCQKIPMKQGLSMFMERWMWSIRNGKERRLSIQKKQHKIYDWVIFRICTSVPIKMTILPNWNRNGSWHLESNKLRIMIFANLILFYTKS